MSITVGAPLVEASSAIMQAWCTDMAQRIHEYPVIADRYGWASEADMFAYMTSHPALCKRIAEQRAVWESDENVGERVRKLAGYTVLEALPNTSSVMFDPNGPAGLRIEALKAHARIAGMDMSPRTVNGADGAGGPAAAKFSVEIVFSDGRAESIKTIDHPPTNVSNDATMIDAQPENENDEEWLR